MLRDGDSPGAAVEQLPEVVRFLLRPESYEHRPPSVEFVQTHISYVFLAGDLVFKIKKPVRFSFLDFSTIERRRFYCAEEVRLNRRLAADVYLGVVSIVADAGGYRFAAADDPAAVEYAVEMKRLPEDRMFSAILAAGAARDDHVDEIAQRLAGFHRQARGGADVAEWASPERLLATMEGDFSEAERYRGRTVSRFRDESLQKFCGGFVRAHAALLRQRQRDDRIRECHGDLRAEHICFADRLVMIDCIEFGEEFRNRDVAAEVGFLAMDIEFLGRPDLAERLVERYAALSRDAALERLVPFYQCYFAYIRGKVESLKALEEEVDRRDRAASEELAKRHFALANRYSWSYSPMVLAVAGLSGSGKTTVAAELASRTGFFHLSSDVVRKELAGLPGDRPSDESVRAELYGEELGRKTYDSLIERARDLAAQGNGVVLDATFQRRSNRDDAATAAAETGAPFLLVECRCDEAEVRRRLEARVRSGRGASDADWQVYVEQRRVYEELADAEKPRGFQVDSGGSLELVCDAIEAEARTRSSTV